MGFRTENIKTWKSVICNPSLLGYNLKGLTLVRLASNLAQIWGWEVGLRMNHLQTHMSGVWFYLIWPHLGMGETTMRRYDGCGDIVSVLLPHAGLPCIAAFLFYFREQLSCLTKGRFKVIVLLPSSFLLRVKNDVPLSTWRCGLVG